MTSSLKQQILESMNPRKKAAPARGKVQKKPIAEAVRKDSAGPKVGAEAIYEGKTVRIQSINENSGMAVVKFPRLREPKIVRMCDLNAKQLNEGVLGLGAVAPTFREMGPSQFVKVDLDPEDIGMIWEGNDETDFGDDQEEAHDNGSNVRQDGHTGKREVDELPTPSDTIAPAYSDEIPPKEMGTPLSIEPGYTVATDPDLDAYDFPADAPVIPKPDFLGGEMGNPRAPHWGNVHNAGENMDKRDPDESQESVQESFDDEYGDEDVPGKGRWRPKHFKKNKADTQRTFPNVKHFTKDGHPDWEKHKQNESFDFILEMDDLLGHEHGEPSKGDIITVTLPAMASIVCTVASKMNGDPNLMRAMIEALAEVGNGKTLDMPDLQAVASHMNGEECQEVENRAAGKPEHQGIDMHGGGEDHGGGDHHGGENHPRSSEWPGDGEKSKSGKTKLLGGMIEGEDEEDVEECGDEMIPESNYYGWDDIVAETPKPTFEEELRIMKRRCGMKFW